jgi:hypothetical protein
LTNAVAWSRTARTWFLPRRLVHPRCIGALRVSLHEGLAGLVAEQVMPIADRTRAKDACISCVPGAICHWGTPPRYNPGSKWFEMFSLQVVDIPKICILKGLVLKYSESTT